MTDREHSIPTSLIRRYSIRKISGRGSERVVDTVAAEEPLATRVSYWQKGLRKTENLAITMRTPGADLALTAGLLLAEGIIQNRKDLDDLRSLGTEPSNEVLAELAMGVDFEAWRQARLGLVSSSCGVCGKASGEAILQAAPKLADDGFRLNPAFIEKLPDLLHSHQQGFSQTGGLHAAAIFTAEGELLDVFEDIGRHNALDKLIGNALLADQVPLSGRILFLSSRSSFELIQKTAMAGAPVIATVGGPSSLAIDTAREHGITLIGFVRDQRFNVYSGEWRLNS